MGEGILAGQDNGASMELSTYINQQPTFLSCPYQPPTYAFICDQGQPYQLESVSIPVTFGTPFLWNDQFDITLIGQNGSYDYTSGAGIFLAGYSIYQNGSLVDGTLAQVPESGTSLLTMLGLCLSAWSGYSLRKANTRHPYGSARAVAMNG
jgi:hypothetical protein